MTELSLNVLDVAQNSVKAGATLISISVNADFSSNLLKITIEDNGCGMSSEQVEKVCDPFFTTRTTRKVGLGVPFFKMAAEMTGGSFKITSEIGKGTVVTAIFVISSIDRMPLGDINGTIETLIVYNTHIDFIYTYTVNQSSFTLSTVEMKNILGDIPLNSPEIVQYIRDFLCENTHDVNSSSAENSSGSFEL